MNSLSLVFPHQLFTPHPALSLDRPVWLVEEYLFFRQYPFHQKKIMLHRASLQAYADELRQQGYQVQVVESHQPESDIRVLLPRLSDQGLQELHAADPTDNWLSRRLREGTRACGIQYREYENPNFINTRADLDAYAGNRKTYFQTDFYIHQRKTRGILLEKNGTPAGGKWSFDSENRERFPKGVQIPPLPERTESARIREAEAYTRTHFSQNPGNTGGFVYPVTRSEALDWLDNFLAYRLAGFGPYEDALVAKESFLFHSVLTPVLNIGLLQPQEIIERALARHEKKPVPLNSLEGFIRQIMGWREFIRLVYEQAGSFQRTRHFWGFHRPVPPSFWTGTTGIVPVDTVIRKLLATGYSHHIERLMVMGNFMLLCEFDPDDVYRWFMEMYIDSYDWVMVPNVYGMTQFADGGLMTTKPYISGSNYLMKMGDFYKGPWQAVWDGLFWRFLHRHRDFFTRNPRLGMLVKTFDKMAPEKRQAHLSAAEKFLQSLDA